MIAALTAAQVHIPVLLTEAVDALAPRDGGFYVDATFGAGGYSRAILDRADCQVVGIDRDPDAQARSREIATQAFAGRFRFVAGRFGEIDRLVGAAVADGIAFDLGVSSPQLDDAARGFSFQKDGPLDMRMEKSGPSAADLVNTAEEAELADIIHELGEDRLARRIARAIVAARAEAPITGTAHLADIVRRAYGAAANKEKLHPATRTFQAIRMTVNDELGEIDRGLAAAERALKPAGRLAVVTFHSLEDRRVKTFIATRSGKRPGTSRHLPPTAETGPAATFRPIGRKPIAPGAGETDANPRARSARLRVAERTTAAAWPDPLSPYQEGAS